MAVERLKFSLRTTSETSCRCPARLGDIFVTTRTMTPLDSPGVCSSRSLSGGTDLHNSTSRPPVAAERQNRRSLTTRTKRVVSTRETSELGQSMLCMLLSFAGNVRRRGKNGHWRRRSRDWVLT